jgi:hypothetical protein
MANRVYHWKHGWIPLDHIAAVKKYGSSKAAQKHGFGGGTTAVSYKNLPRQEHVTAHHDGTTGEFHVRDLKNGNRAKLSMDQADQHQLSGKQISGIGPHGGVQTKVPVKPLEPDGEFEKSYGISHHRWMYDHEDDKTWNKNQMLYVKEGWSLNKVARGQEVPKVFKRQAAAYEKWFDENALTMDKDTVLIRGIHEGPGFSISDTYQEGSEVPEPGWLSVTSNSSIADMFATEGGYKVAVKVPAGSKYVFGAKAQSEVVLARNSRYEVLRVDHSTRQIDLELKS